jgi:hypothetical protein
MGVNPVTAVMGAKYGAEIGGALGALASGHAKQMQAVVTDKVKGVAGAAVSAATEGEHQVEGAVQQTANQLGMGEQTAAALDDAHETVSAAAHSATAHWVAEHGAYVTGGIGLASAFLGHALGLLKAGAIGAAAGAAVGTGVGFVQSHNASRT